MTSLAVCRPVAISCISASLALLGVGACWTMPVEMLPAADLPRLTVRTTWSGVSPEAVEALVTAPLEALAQQLRGSELIRSETREGAARIEIRLSRGTRTDFARLELSERVAALRPALPAGVGPIVVEPWVPEDAWSEQPLLRWSFTGPLPVESLQRFLDERVVAALSRIDGVAAVWTSGGREQEVVVRLNPMPPATPEYTPGILLRELAQLGRETQVGTLRMNGHEQGVGLGLPSGTLAELRELPLAMTDQTLVRFADVAEASAEVSPAYHIERIDGHTSVRLSVYREQSANAVRVSRAVREHLSDLASEAPEGSRFLLENDEGAMVANALVDVTTRGIVSAAVIALILSLVFRSVMAVVPVLGAVIVSSLIALAAAHSLGLSLNLLTLAGLALGFGMMVDNAIVVVDAIERQRRCGEIGGVAAVRGTGEVMPAIVGGTFTTLAALVPLAYLQGELRAFYLPLSVVLGLSLMISLVVASTLVPALTTRLPRLGALGTRAPLQGRAFDVLRTATLKRPGLALLVTAVLLFGSWRIFERSVTRGVVWADSGALENTLLIDLRLPHGSSVQRTAELVTMVESRLVGRPHVKRVSSSIGDGQAFLVAAFSDSSGAPGMIREHIEAWASGIGGAEIRVYGAGPAFQGASAPAPTYAVQVVGYEFGRVAEIATDVGERLKGVARVRDVDTQADGRRRVPRGQEYLIRPDRERLADVGMSARRLVEHVRDATVASGHRATMSIGGIETPVRVLSPRVQELDVASLPESLIEASNGQTLRLGSVATIAASRTPGVIRREDQQYERTVTWEFRGSAKLGDELRDALITNTRLPPGYGLRALGDRRWTVDERRHLLVALALGLAFVFCVTAALFESLRQPWVVLLSAPSMLIGIFLAFTLSGATFTREAWVGVILTGGISVNNAILLVAHANRIRRSGVPDSRAAILQATNERVRPILTMTATTVLGVLPMFLFDTHIDAGIWNALALTLAAGLSSSALFTLTVTPALYHLFEGGRESATFRG